MGNLTRRKLTFASISGGLHTIKVLLKNLKSDNNLKIYLIVHILSHFGLSILYPEVVDHMKLNVVINATFDAVNSALYDVYL